MYEGYSKNNKNSDAEGKCVVKGGNTVHNSMY